MDIILGIAAVILATLEAVRWIHISHRFNCMAIEIEKVAMELEELREDFKENIVCL